MKKQMILSNHEDLIRWVQKMPTYYDAEEQIFVHAGVDEEAGEYWMWGTSEDMLLGKFTASKGKFYKTIIAGHVGTGTRDLANDRTYHDIFLMERAIITLMDQCIRAESFFYWNMTKVTESIIRLNLIERSP